jgi:hypothetical protein
MEAAVKEAATAERRSHDDGGDDSQLTAPSHARAKPPATFRTPSNFGTAPNNVTGAFNPDQSHGTPSTVTL